MQSAIVFNIQMDLNKMQRTRRGGIRQTATLCEEEIEKEEFDLPTDQELAKDRRKTVKQPKKADLLA